MPGISAKQWIQKTNAIGIISKAGRYGGTYAHKDMAFEGVSGVSPHGPFKQFARYWPRFSKFNSSNVIFMTNTLASEPPDAGWKTLLALALEKIPDRAARITELEAFYRF